MDEARRSAAILGGLSSVASTSIRLGIGSATTVEDVLNALNEFSEVRRYLNTRRSTGTIFELDSEADVQDALFVILRPWIRDLVWEAPTDKVANRFTVRDFVSRSLRCVIEAKFVRDAAHGKGLSKELHDDIEVYRHVPACDTIIFFVFDPNALIPDGHELRRTIEEHRAYSGKPLSCKLVIKP